MRIYIAGSSDERLSIVRPLIKQVEEMGHTITFDWTSAPEWDLGREPTEAELQSCAQQDLEGVLACDILWYVMPETKSEGSATEFGVALGLLAIAPSGAPLIIASGSTRLGHARRIFPLLPQVTLYDTHLHALLALKDMPR